MTGCTLQRREFISLAGLMLSTPLLSRAQQAMMTRVIPASGESLPVIGLGTSDEFEVNNRANLDELKAVLTTLLDNGGTLVDTAPTYGNAETVLGHLFTDLNLQHRLFIATKISLWRIPLLSRQVGIDQMVESTDVLGKSPLDLIQVHNLNDLETQWQNLMDWKAAGRVRYIGVTIYRYSQFERLEQFLRGIDQIDFVQLNYSLMEPRADEVLIPLAADKGAAIIVNRPFADGAYFRRLRGKTLPVWAADFDCESWAQFTLKWILGNTDVTCAIPATSDPRHMLDNARAGMGRLPDRQQRRQMREYMQTL